MGTPTVTGPRTTTSERPVYRFRAARAVSFRCAFDSRSLHVCAARYTQRLAPGKHLLRVRAVGRGGDVSRVVAVPIAVTVPYARLTTDPPVQVGAGAGVPAVDGGVWVPVTETGELARVDPASRSVTSKAQVGVPAGGQAGLLDSAIAAGGSIWYTSDAGGTVVRVDPATGERTAAIAAGARPGGLAAGGGAVWAFGFLGPDVTRVDVATNSKRVLHVDGLAATGIAFGGGALWLLSSATARIIEVDPDSGATLASFDLRPPSPPEYSVIDTWWLAYDDGAVWATLPNQGAVARLDVATRTLRYARAPYGRPFGVTVGDGSAWVATDHGVLRLDGATGKPTGVALLPTANHSGFVSIAAAGGSAWFTNYDRGTVTRASG